VKVEVRELFDGSFRIYNPDGELIPYEEVDKKGGSCQERKLRIKRVKRRGDILPLQIG
jgi:hypothetical protein